MVPDYYLNRDRNYLTSHPPQNTCWQKHHVCHFYGAAFNVWGRDITGPIAAVITPDEEYIPVIVPTGYRSNLQMNYESRVFRYSSSADLSTEVWEELCR